MAKKLQRRLLSRMVTSKAKTQRRKFKAPTRGLEVHLEQINKPVLDRLLAKVLAQ